MADRRVLSRVAQHISMEYWNVNLLELPAFNPSFNHLLPPLLTAFVSPPHQFYYRQQRRIPLILDNELLRRKLVHK